MTSRPASRHFHPRTLRVIRREGTVYMQPVNTPDTGWFRGTSVADPSRAAGRCPDAPVAVSTRSREWRTPPCAQR